MGINKNMQQEKPEAVAVHCIGEILQAFKIYLG